MDLVSQMVSHLNSDFPLINADQFKVVEPLEKKPSGL